MNQPYNGPHFNEAGRVMGKCFGKPCYLKKLAETVRNRRQKESGENLRIYSCPECNFWHIAHERPHTRSKHNKI